MIVKIYKKRNLQKNMEHFIKEVFKNKKISTRAHEKFIRYSKGIYVGPLIKISKQKEKIKIKSSFHIVDELIHLAAKFSKEEDAQIKGTINHNEDLAEEFAKIGIKYIKVKKSRGIFKYEIDNILNLKTFEKNMLKYNPLINFSTSNVKLTTKKSFPKPSKDITSNFCYLELPLESADYVYKFFAFDIKETPKKTVDISHEFIIEEVIYPENKNLDFKQIRELSKRKGKVKRTVKITPDITTDEINLLA